MIRVRGPDGSIANFPDGTSDAVITRAMAQAYGGPGGSKTGPITGYLTTAARGIPGLTELGAGYSAAVRTVDDALHGRPLDVAQRFSDARREQQGVVDQFQGDHPIASANATALGTIAPAAVLGGAGLVRAGSAAAARAAAGRLALAEPASGSVLQRAGIGATRLAAAGGRNAMTGAAVGGVYGAAQPGTLDQRAGAGLRAMPGGAAAGVAIPALLGGAVKGVQLGRNAFQAVAPRVGAVASEAADSVSRAVTGKSTTDQAKPIPPDVAAQGQQAAVDYLRRIGVTPEQLEASMGATFGKPITTAEAIGATGISQATGLARRAGTTPAIADATMTARGQDRARRILGDVTQATGVDPEAAKGSIDALVEQGQKAAKPLYDVALEQGADQQTPVWSSQLEALTQRPQIRRAIKTAISLQQSAGRNPHALGLTFMEDPPRGDDLAAYLDDPTPPPVARGPAKLPSRGLSMLQYVARNGGIQDQGGEITAMDGDKWHVGRPFEPRLIDPEGDGADGWGERLQEAGYLPAGDRPTERDVYDAIGDEIRGRKQFARPADQAAMDRYLNASTNDERAAWEANYGGDIPSPDQYQGGDQPTTSPVQMAVPTAETWDIVKKAMDRNVERDKFTGEPISDRISLGNHAINIERGALTAQLRQDIPGYGDALDTAGDYLSIADAFARAKGKLFSTTLDPREFDAYFRGLSPSEQNATRASLANEILTKVNNGQLYPGAFKPPAVAQKLATAFGPEAAKDLVARMEVEARMSAASARMTPNTNSVTGDVLGSDTDRADLDTTIRLGGAGLNALSGRPVAAVKGVGSALLPLVAAARQPASMAARNALGTMLYQDPAATAAAMRAATNAIEPEPLPDVPRSVTALQFAPSAAAGQSPPPDQPSP